jgi:hypothetical protein
MKKLAYDNMQLDQSQIVEDSKCCLKVNAVITKTGVYKYDDGWAYKSPMELLKATRTARYAKLTLHNHPPTKVIMTQKDLYGGIEKPFFDRDKIRATLNFDKDVVPNDLQQKIRDAVEKKVGLDVSIGFYYSADFTPGIAQDVNTGENRSYDYIMRDILIDHVAVMLDGSVKGRCTFPHCGIGVDTIMQRFDQIQAEGDKVVKRGDKWCVIHCHGEEEGEVIKCFETEEEAQAMHRAIQARKHGINMEETDQEKPPADWFEKCKAVISEGMPEYTEEQVNAVCGNIWYHRPEQHGIGDAHVILKALIEKGGIKSMSEKTPAGAQEEEMTPLERCIKNRMETKGETREQATEWCKAELAGEHEAVDALIERSKKLINLRQQQAIEERRASRRHPL